MNAAWNALRARGSRDNSRFFAENDTLIAKAAGSHGEARASRGGAKMEPVGMTIKMMHCGYQHGANIARIAAELAN